MNKLIPSVFIFVLLLFGGLFWIEHQTQTDLQHRLSVWTSRPAQINALSLGLFESEITDISIPTESPSRFTNDIEVGSIKVAYSHRIDRQFNNSRVRHCESPYGSLERILWTKHQDLTNQVRPLFQREKVIQRNNLTVLSKSINSRSTTPPSLCTLADILRHCGYHFRAT